MEVPSRLCNLVEGQTIVFTWKYEPIQVVVVIIISTSGCCYFQCMDVHPLDIAATTCIGRNLAVHTKEGLGPIRLRIKGSIVKEQFKFIFLRDQPDEFQ